MWPDRIDVVSDMAWSSVALLGEVMCLADNVGDVGIGALKPAGSVDSWPGTGELGTKTVFRTSRRPRIVPALRLIPEC